MWKDKIFWFSQPSILLNSYDYKFFWAFVAVGVLGLVLKVLARFFRHPVSAKLLNKFANATFWTGILGLIWFGLRFENTPIFSNRIWAGIIALIFLLWILFILKYLFTKFGPEKRSFDQVQLNSRYIPGSKK